MTFRLLGWLSAFGLLACQKSDSEPGRGLLEKKLSEAALTDAPEVEQQRPGSGPSRCSPAPGAAPSMVAGSGSSVIEFSEAAAGPDGFDVGILRSGETSEPQVIRLGRSGGMQKISLGRITGQTEPPKLATKGKTTVVVISDNDASNSLLRLAKLSSADEVTWGPEVGRGRGQSVDFDVALTSEDRGLLVWDLLGKGSARGTISGLVFDARSMKELSAPRVLSDPAMDVELPRLVPTSSGYWLVFLAYESPSPSSPAGRDERGPERLVETIPQRLMVRRIDGKGRKLTEPLAVTEEPSDALVFDAVQRSDGRLLIAYRASTPDRPDGETVVRLATVSDAGSVERAAAESRQQLGPGVPALLSGGPEPWLYVGGPSGRCLLTQTQGPGAGAPSLVEEPSLFGTIPLAAHGDLLLVARPRALDLDLELHRCGPASAGN